MSTDDDAEWLQWMTKQFESIAGEDKEIDLEEFKTALKVKEARFLLGVGNQRRFCVPGEGTGTEPANQCR